jgi:putative transposase
MKGAIDLYVFFFIHVESRRVYLAGMTANPDGAGMKQHARNVALHFAEQPVKPTMLIRDYDSKFTKEFDAIFQSEGVAIKKIGARAPNMSAHAERWVQSVRSECLDHFVVLGESHLRYILSSYVVLYNSKRPHQSLNNAPLGGLPPREEPPCSPLPMSNVSRRWAASSTITRAKRRERRHASFLNRREQSVHGD